MTPINIYPNVPKFTPMIFKHDSRYKYMMNEEIHFFIWRAVSWSPSDIQQQDDRKENYARVLMSVRAFEKIP